MSSSPPLTPPHGDTVHEAVSPVGEPDVERELTPTESVRERADGETSPPLVQSSIGSDKESEKEKETKRNQDLDKDIDAMFEYNANGYADSSVSVDSIPVDSFNSTLKDISIKTSSFTEKQGSRVNGVETHGDIISHLIDTDRHEDSEKSFTSISTSNSSVLAEAVVNRVLTNAVKLAKEGEDTSVSETQTVSGDVKVGLFQYQADDMDVESAKGDGEESKTYEPVIQADPGDVKVGLFQYYDDEEDNLQQNLNESDAEDYDEKLESLNLSDHENILHLYGLEGSEVTETRRMSTPPSSPRTEEEKNKFFIDVQREVYEPQKRMFSVTQDKSSTESTPRDKVLEVMSPTAREDTESDLELKEDTVTETVQEKEKSPTIISPVKTEQEKEGNISVREDEVDSEIESDKDIDTLASSQTVSIEVAPPLIQYESVKENGKFRIIKTPKEGGGPAFGIRVGADTSSQSPQQSPRETDVKDKIQQPKHEVVEERTTGTYKDRNGDMEGQMEKPLNSVSQVLPIVTPSSSSEVEGQERLWLPSDGQVIRSLPESKELPRASRDEDKTVSSAILKEPSLSKSELGVPVSQGQSSKSYEESRSHRQLTEKQASPRRFETDSRIKYSTTDTNGRENKRTGPVPYNIEEYREVPGKDYSRRPTPYEAELIESAYKRVTKRTGEPVPKVMTPAIESGTIPGYKTLQEQQARWASMFQTLEEQHKVELRSQYERHQHNIQRLQQQMETELQKQHQTIRKKLDIHKEALRRMSPERDSLSPERGFKSPDAVQRSPLQEQKSPVGSKRSPVRDQRSPPRNQRSPAYGQVVPERDDNVSATRSQISAERMTPVRSQRSPERSSDRRSRSADGSLERQESKSWREIYREVRAEEEKRDPTPPPPIRRSLEGDFASIEDTTLTRSRLSMNRSAFSPRPRISPDRERILQGRERISPERDRISPGKDVYKGHDRSKQETPERLRTGVKRESRSRTKRSPPQQQVPPLALDKEEPGRTSPLRPTSISPHVQELLDNLNEGRSSLRGLQSPPLHVDTGGAGRPRAGVYSSPMPLLAGRVSQSTQSTRATLDALTTSLDASRSLPYNAERSVRSEPDGGRRSREPDTKRHEDSYLSSSSRLNLREKHSKHLADLRSYYEEELRELRRALTDSLDTSGASVDQSAHTTIQSQLLEAENKHLLDKCRAMEDEIDDAYQRIRELEQKGRGLEKRASEYAAAFADSQAMGVQNRAHIEELQRYCRERDDLVNDLEAKVRSQEDAMKIYKKNLEEELEFHRQDKSALQRIVDKYETMEREQKLLHDTINSTENKLYETRTEVVELNRAISKLELENKRLGRENDNLRHKVTQSINLTSMHESFGSPPSPRQQEPPVRRQTASPVPFTSLSTDTRVPSFTAPPEPRPQSAGASGTRGTTGVGREKTKKSKPANWKDMKQNIPETKDKKKQPKSSSSREDLTQRPRSQQSEREPSQERQLRDATPPRPASGASQSESETGDYSPLIKAERELYKLRDMMRQAVAVKPASSPPPEPVLQKKFYGSERPSGKDEYVPDFGTPRGKHEKQSSSHTGVVKTKSNTSQSRQDRSSDKEKSSRKTASTKYDKNAKPKDKGSGKERSKDADKQLTRTPTKKDQGTSGISVNPEEFDSPTRFDININEDTKTLSVKKVPQSGKQKNLFAESNQSVWDTSHDQIQQSHDECTQTNDEADPDMQQTLDRIRAGGYMTRPQWENVFTSMAKPKPEQEQKVKAMTREDKIKARLQNITDMEHRYDELQAEKRELESRLTKVPIHGRVDRNNRRQKEELEESLDAVEKELGSLRMSLKRCNVLKTAA